MPIVFAKLANYTGNSLKNLIAPLEKDNGPNADRYVFR
jgi:60S ribosome subunit biogenesis protein NIP7